MILIRTCLLLTFFSVQSCVWLGDSEQKLSAAKQSIPIEHLPNALTQKIQQHVDDSGWSHGCATISEVYYRSYRLDKERQLFIISVPDYLCNNSNSFITAIRDQKQFISWSQPYEGEINHIAQSSVGTLFLSSYWTIEGAYPMLYQSDNGIDWKKVPLPSPLKRDCCFQVIEALRVNIYRENELLLIEYSNDGPDAAETWQTPLVEGAIAIDPNWEIK